MANTLFPPKLRLGAASSAYQIEGATGLPHRGPCVWDMFSERAGKIYEGHRADRACDHVARMEEDVALLGGLGLEAYRFSLSWPRVLPDGCGVVNQAGLDFYDRLVDKLLAHGIEPWATLFHWDLPRTLYLRGGWLNRDCASWFSEYTALVVEKLSDRVVHWMPMNEPQCFIGLGLSTGVHAPGDRLGDRELLLAAHHCLLAHGASVSAARASARRPLRVGSANVGITSSPASNSEADISAARSVMFSGAGGSLNPVWNNTWWSDPMFFGRYPEDGVRHFGALMPDHFERDLPTISQPLDFLGVNVYSSDSYRCGADGKPQRVPYPVGGPQSHFHWSVTPECLYWAPRFLHERYGKPVVITENGLAGADWVDLDGRVRDAHRVDFTRRYLLELSRAVADGVPVDAYFHWSILDNFEWAEGYKQRFGLIHVDFETQQRTVKDSARWYAEVIRTRGASLRSFLT
ncbi:GH1 family beta-glucosidase [Nibricoccus sp. IMCC34717]|uniref:GH1 family beta-glucosidase n=1 Tax=Nibricoccus sp. IMCC34717 TaxID=3034021 RepID=UPI00384B091D